MVVLVMMKHGLDTLSKQLARKWVWTIKANRRNVVDVGYRVGPEHMYPIPMNDCEDVLQWVYENASYFKSNGQISMGGISAGGQIAGVLSHVARDKGIPIAAALLSVPVCDATALDENWNLKSDAPKSWHEHHDCPFLNYERMAFFYKNFIPPGYDRTDPYLSLAYATNFKDLPPTLVVTAEVDVLCSEGDKYAEKLKANGVDVIHKRMGGVTHHFEHLYAVEPKSIEYREFSIDWIKLQYENQKSK